MRALLREEGLGILQGISREKSVFRDPYEQIEYDERVLFRNKVERGKKKSLFFAVWIFDLVEPVLIP